MDTPVYYVCGRKRFVLRRLPAGRNVRLGLDRVALETPVILLKTSKQSIHVVKELLVIMLGVPMMLVMPTTSGTEAKWNDVLGRPGEIKTTMKFSQ